MREQLIQYVDLLFAGAPGSEDIRQEILQNTLDRYDDLIIQGKSPQAAYQLAISGIGDIHEILGGTSEVHTPSSPRENIPVAPHRPEKRIIRAAAICFFILCAVPLLILENSIGLGLCLAMIACGVGLLTLNGPEQQESAASALQAAHPRRSAINRGITGGIWGAGLCAYFLISFFNNAWHITWLIFPLLGCICGFVDACFDLSKKPVGAIIRLVLFFLLIGIFVSLGLGLTFGYVSYSSTLFSTSGIIGEYNTSEGSVAAAEIRELEIKWVAGSITIQTGQTDSISFEESYYGEDTKPMIWKQSGDKLILQYSEPTVSIGFFSSYSVSKDLIVTVPEDWACSALSIDSVSASIQVNSLTCSALDLINVSGSCRLEGCRVTDFDLETVSGKVYFQGELQQLDCDSISADCELHIFNFPEAIDMDGVSCDLILYLPESCGFTVKLDSASGDFDSDFSFSSKNGSYIHGDGSCRIDMDSVSGDIRIRQAD